MSRKTIIPIVVFLALIITYIVISSFMGRFHYNSNDTVGNTAGNLYNKGLFAESDGRVYFSNRNDEGTLYSMKPDETDYKKIVAANVTYINAAGNYVYYYQDSNIAATGDLSSFGNMIGIYRSDLTGSHIVCLNRNPACMMSLIGNYIYWENIDDTKGAVLCKINIDKKTPYVQLTDYVVDCSSVLDGSFYYAGTVKDHNLYRWDTASDTSSVVMEGSVWNPIATSDGIFYMNVNDNYRLYRCGSDGSDPTKLTDDRIDCYNLVGDKIYYQKNSADSPALMRINTDGSDPETVMAGNFTDINSTSEYVYFLRFDTDSPVYQTPVSGDINVTAFNPDVIKKK